MHWSSAPRRSATSATSRCARWRSCGEPTWPPARTRATRARCCDRHGIDLPLIALHEHNERAQTPALLRLVAEASASACCPTPACRPCPIRAPGSCREAIAAGAELVVLPGPSSVTTALVASGMAGGGFVFAGFLPRSAGALAALLDRLDAAGLPMVAFESPRRLPATLARAGAARPRQADGGLPRADQAARAGRARRRRIPGGALRRSPQGRGDAGAGGRARRPRRRCPTRRSWPSWRRPWARSGRPRWHRSCRVCPATASTPASPAPDGFGSRDRSQESRRLSDCETPGALLNGLETPTRPAWAVRHEIVTRRHRIVMRIGMAARWRFGSRDVRVPLPPVESFRVPPGPSRRRELRCGIRCHVPVTTVQRRFRRRSAHR